MTRLVRRAAVLVALASGLGACAAADKSANAPRSEGYAGAAAQPQQPGAYPSVPTTPPASPAPPPPPASPQPGSAPAQPGSVPQGEPSKSSQSRDQALQSAANEVDTSQRELDVAAGDCRNACRALGSMDRAAGRLCGLTQGESELRRCDDAKRRVYSARDRVKATCGQCENGASVDRSAPIPSLR
jgi:hypothetical protein